MPAITITFDHPQACVPKFVFGDRIAVKDDNSPKHWLTGEVIGMTLEQEVFKPQWWYSVMAVFVGSLAIKVDANYTSKGCPKCGHVSDNNRPNKGLTFRCECCHFELHSDLVGARNITLRTILSRQDWERTGALSVRPDASSSEAKAERLARYSELRWSSDASRNCIA